MARHERPDHQAPIRGQELVAGGSRELAPIYPSLPGYASIDDDRDVDVWRILGVLMRRRLLILALAAAGVALGGLQVLRQTPLYEAKASIEVQRQESQIIEGGSVDPAVIADAEHMATQYALLRSRALAERVAEVLDLPKDARYADQAQSRDVRLNAAVGVLQQNFKVSPVVRSRVIEVSYVSPDPADAARVANAFAENFIETNLERKFNSTAYARSFLEERLQSTKTALETSERQLVDYAREHQILDLGAGDASQVNDSLEATSLRSLNEALSEAQNQRIAAEQRFIEAQSNPAILDTQANETVAQIRTRRSELWAEYQEKLATLRPEFPTMVELKTRIDALDNEVAAHHANLVRALQGEFNAAAAREESLKQRILELSGSLQNERGDRIDYNILRREVDTNRSQYEALLQRLKEVSISSGIAASQVAIVDRAKVPQRPFSPDVPRVLLLAFVLGLGLGIGAAFLLDYMDDTVKSPEDVTQKLGLPCIGVVPKSAGKLGLIEELGDPRSRVTEAFSSARAALHFATPSGPPQSILVTGTRPGEGKTISAVGLALSFAGTGQRVLIIDADMRKPSFKVKREASIGLSGILTGGGELVQSVIPGPHPNLFLLPCGVVPPNPGELLASSLLHHVISEGERLFDIVIVDAPPVLGFADAPLLGSVCQGTLLIVQSGAIRRPAIQRSISRMLAGRAIFLGALISKYDLRYEKYGYGYGGFGYGYGDEDDKRYRRGRAGDRKAEAARQIDIFDRGDRGSDPWPGQN